MRKTLVAFLVAGLAGGASACSDSSGGGGGTVTQATGWDGLVEGRDGIEMGALGIGVLTANPRVTGPGNDIALAPGDVQADAVYFRSAPSPDTLDLTGTYDPVSRTVTVSGSGYVFTGIFDGQSRLDGTFTGPTTNGTFITMEETGPTEVYCGTYAGGDTGTWNFIFQGSELRGQAQSSTGVAPVSFEGVASGTNLTFDVAGTQDALATGTLTIPDDSASGTWSKPSTQVSGTWQAGQCK